jgi:ABC-type polysaccharide/polyol phosphate export permease
MRLNLKNFRNFFLNVIEIKKYQYVLYQLVRQQLTLRYRRTLFGYFWTLLNPILMMTVTAVVFSSLFKLDLRSFAVFLFAGMIPWNLFNASVAQSSSAFIYNESLIKKIYLPKIIFPLSISLSVLIESFLSFCALLLIILVIGGKFSVALLFIPIAYFLLFIFCFGIALFISVSTVFFRDIQYVIGIALQALFFLTPVIYKKNSLAGKVGWIVDINPIGFFIDLFRYPIDLGILPGIYTLLFAVFMSAISLILGCIFFFTQQNKIVFRV